MHSPIAIRCNSLEQAWTQIEIPARAFGAAIHNLRFVRLATVLDGHGPAAERVVVRVPALSRDVPWRAVEEDLRESNDSLVSGFID